MGVRGRGRDFIPKAVGRRRRMWPGTGIGALDCSVIPFVQGSAHKALPLSRAVFRCGFIHSFIHTDAHQVPDFKKPPAQGRRHTERSICDITM